ncbi:hypothetical protein ACTMTJ_38330 [Phytohabitans sp. LJ34]|uniref:hypothetical protein n=1 Tax=Phytohabitans sp. LJ34 TaxID=3452217 RepID=UPI003F8B1399
MAGHIAATALDRLTGADDGYRSVQQLRSNAEVYPRWPLVLITVGSAILTAAVTTTIVLAVVWLFGA